MKTIKFLITERIAALKVEIEQNKDHSRWANCLSLSGGISELQGLASDIAATTNAIHSDGEGCAVLENIEYNLDYVDSETIILTRRRP